MYFRDSILTSCDLTPMTTSASNTARIDARSRLMVALDVPTAGDARRIVDQLGERVEFFKVGLELFTGTGLEVCA